MAAEDATRRETICPEEPGRRPSAGRSSGRPPRNALGLIRLLLVSAALAASAGGLFPAIAQDDEDQPIRVDSSLVLVSATVSDKSGKPLFGLARSDFRVFEDGVEQRIDLFQTEKAAFAAVILLDTSGSMEARVSLARSAAIRFLEGLREDDVAAIYNFDSKVSLVQDFSNSRDIVEGIFDLKAAGMTVLNDAVLRAARELSSRPEGRRAIIVLSDGADTRSGVSPDRALREALNAGATIYTVDMSSIDSKGSDRMQNQGVLKNYAEKSGGRFIATPGGAALRDAFRSIVEELGTQYTIGYQPANTARDGKWRTIELKSERPGISIRARKGYNAVKDKK